METIKYSKQVQKYLDILKGGRIEERELISMRSLMNKDKKAASAIFSNWPDEEITLNPEQVTKGYEFLLNRWKTPRNTERENNPYGYREQYILNNFRDITLKSLYNAGNAYHDAYLPLYSCNSQDGSGFEYYYNGEINIVG